MNILHSLSALALMASASAYFTSANAEDDELVRLPKQGEVRDKKTKDRLKADRLKPGGGLFITFDSDTNGSISFAEISAGIPIAFAAADANEDGFLTALEQQAWASRLPTRDDSLANPTRFDPNLDRRVDISEFTKVITGLGTDYADEVTGEIIVASLTAPAEKPRRRGINLFDGELRPSGSTRAPRN